MDEVEDFVYKPCRNCGCTVYKNTRGEVFKEVSDGRLSVEPAFCDKCDFDLMLQENEILH